LYATIVKVNKNHSFLDSSVAYIDGTFVPFSEATLSIASAPVQYGLSVYTAFNIVYSERGFLGFRLKDHYQRLCNSAQVMGMQSFESYCNYESLVQLISTLVAKNNLDQSVIVRINYYVDAIMAGTQIHDLPVGLSMFVLPFTDYYTKSTLDVCVSSWRRIADDAIPPRAKVTGSYVNSSLMKSEALLNGYDDCIALDHNGHVAEGAVANIFIVRNGILITPTESSDILEGITRNTVQRIAVELGIPTQVRAIDRSELYIADEIFFSGSSARIWPIASVDRRIIGSGRQGPVTAQLAGAYSDIQAGKSTIERSWLTALPLKKEKTK
jgi:branched-chain amino acid aminotransferase